MVKLTENHIGLVLNETKYYIESKDNDSKEYLVLEFVFYSNYSSILYKHSY